MRRKQADLVFEVWVKKETSLVVGSNPYFLSTPTDNWYGQSRCFCPIWAYWACFTPGSSARHNFFTISFTKLSLRCTFLRDLMKDTPLVKECRKSPAPGGFQTHNLHFTRHVFYRCATTAALWTVKIFLETKSKIQILSSLQQRQLKGWYLMGQLSLNRQRQLMPKIVHSSGSSRDGGNTSSTIAMTHILKLQHYSS